MSLFFRRKKTVVAFIDSIIFVLNAEQFDVCEEKAFQQF